MRNFRWQIILLIASIALISGVIINRLRSGGRADPIVLSDDQGSRFAEAIVGQPQHINPLLAVSQPDRDLTALLFNGLTTLNQYGEPIPDLAESWQLSDDGLIYTFTLRRDVVWHDGEPFTARDVDFTIALLRDPNFAGPEHLRSFWSTIETSAQGDYSVRFALTQPLSSFPEFLRIGILPAHLLQGTTGAGLANLEFNLQPVGTGPLRLESITQEGRTVVALLTPNLDYHDQQNQISFGQVILRFYPDDRSALNALERGEVSALGGLTAEQLDDTVFKNDNLNLYSTLTPAYGAIIFNQQEPDRLPFFQNADVRTALTMALDRQSMVSTTLSRQAILANSPILPGNWAFDPTTQVQPYNPQSAANLLDGEGWLLAEDGGPRNLDDLPLAFTLVVSDDPAFRQLGNLAVEQWADLGIDVRLEVVTASELRSQRLIPRAYDAAIIEFGQGGMADPDPYPFWHQTQIENGQNYSGFDDRDVSEALETARRDPNGIRRVELYREFQQLFNQRSAAILLYYPLYNYAVDCRIAGVQLALLTTSSDRFRTIGQWHLQSPDNNLSTCP